MSSRATSSGATDDVTLPIAVSAVALLVAICVAIAIVMWCRRRNSRRRFEREVAAARQERQRDPLAALQPLPGAQPWLEPKETKIPRWKRLFTRQRNATGSGADASDSDTAVNESTKARRRAKRRTERRKLRELSAAQPHWWKAPFPDSSSSSASDSDDATRTVWDQLSTTQTRFPGVGSYHPPPCMRLQIAAKRMERRAAPNEKRWTDRLKFWRRGDPSCSSESEAGLGRRSVYGRFPTQDSPEGVQAGGRRLPRPVEAHEIRLSARRFEALPVPQRAGDALTLVRREAAQISARRRARVSEATVGQNANPPSVLSPHNPLRTNGRSPLAAAGTSPTLGPSLQRGMEGLFEAARSVEPFDPAVLASSRRRRRVYEASRPRSSPLVERPMELNTAPIFTLPVPGGDGGCDDATNYSSYAASGSELVSPQRQNRHPLTPYFSDSDL
jgi:hypothetical protein